METLNAHCGLCGNESGYNKESLEASTHIINGNKIVLCCPCEDDLVKLVNPKPLNKAIMYICDLRDEIINNGLEDEIMGFEKIEEFVNNPYEVEE